MTIRHQRILISTLIVLTLAGLAGQAVAQYLMPPDYTSIFKADYAGVRLFKESLGLGHLGTVSSAAFVQLFRGFTLLTYFSYAGLLLSAHKANGLDLRRGLVFVGVVASTVAVLFPPGMSSDVFSYLAYAHMPARHLNPYFTPPSTLIALGDPVAAYLPHIDPRLPAAGLKWNIPTVYGPVWTMTSSGLSMLGGRSLFAQAVLLKLLEAGAVMIAAYGAYTIARSTAPLRAPVIFLAVGLNPLLLAEGPGAGHNDMLMMALVVLAGGFLVRRLPTRAALVLGAAVGVKVIPILVVPWMMWEYRDRLAAPVKLLKAASAFLAPVVLAFVPYWQGPSTLRSILLRGTVKPTSDAGLSSTIGTGHAGPTLWTMVHDNAIVVIAYAVLTSMVLLMSRRGGQAVDKEAQGASVSWALAWSMMSVIVVYFLLKLLFPWYAIWMWTAAMVSWTRSHLNLALISSSISLMTSWLYTLSNSAFAGNLICILLLTTVVLTLVINYFSYACKINKKTYTVELCLFYKSAV